MLPSEDLPMVSASCAQRKMTGKTAFLGTLNHKAKQWISAQCIQCPTSSLGLGPGSREIKQRSWKFSLVYCRDGNAVFG